MDFVEQLLESIFKSLVFGALVEFTYEVTAGAEGVVAESQGSIAEILPVEKGHRFSQCVLESGRKRELCV